MKPLEIAQSRDRAGDMQMQRRRAMSGQIDVKSLADGGDLQECGHAAAPRHIGLLHVHRASFEHLADIRDRVGVFARRDIHFNRGLLANRPKPTQIVRRNRLLEPADILICEMRGERQRLFDRVSAICIDE